MNLYILMLVLAGILSACSAISAGSEIQPVLTPTNVIKPPDNSVLQPTNQVSKDATTVAQSVIITPATPQATIPVSTPTIVETKTPTVVLTTEVTPETNTGSAIIADHTVINKFTTIPSNYLAAAAETKTLFKHQSTGDNIEYLGLQCLAGLHDEPGNYPQECSDYAQYSPYDNRQWDWEMWADTTSDAIFKTDQWVSVVNSQQNNYQVLGMKLCYVDSWNLDFEYYREKMEELESAYPQKKFIWSTTALVVENEVSNNLAMAKNIQIFNEQLRAYAIANNKILYDLAAIESHDPDGNYCQPNGYEALCNVYYDNYGGGGGGHPDVDGSIRMAKGFWWLMARISGWNGNP